MKQETPLIWSQQKSFYYLIPSEEKDTDHDRHNACRFPCRDCLMKKDTPQDSRYDITNAVDRLEYRQATETIGTQHRQRPQAIDTEANDKGQQAIVTFPNKLPYGQADSAKQHQQDAKSTCFVLPFLQLILPLILCV